MNDKGGKRSGTKGQKQIVVLSKDSQLIAAGLAQPSSNSIHWANKDETDPLRDITSYTNTIIQRKGMTMEPNWVDDPKVSTIRYAYAAPPCWRGKITALDTSTNSALEILVLDAAGRPMAGVPVAFWWPDAPKDAKGGLGKGQVAPTNEKGLAYFAMGKKAYIKERYGPHAVWIERPGEATDIVSGFGFLMDTNHHHYNAVFQQMNSTLPDWHDVNIFDSQGAKRDTAWLVEQFGQVELVRATEAEAGYHVEKVYETHGGPFSVKVYGSDSHPVPGVDVAFRSIIGAGTGERRMTDDTGVALFTLGEEHLYSSLDQKGPMLVTVRHLRSDTVLNLGVVRQANEKHLNVVFRYRSPDGPGPVEPPADDEIGARWALLYSKLDLIAGLLAAKSALLEDQLAALEKLITQFLGGDVGE